MSRVNAVMGSGYESLGRYLDVSFANLMAFLIGTGLVVTTLWLREIVWAASRRRTLSGWWTFVVAAALEGARP